LGKFKELDHVEALACSGGCVGGALQVEYRHVATYCLKQRLQRQMKAEESGETVYQNYSEEVVSFDEKRIPVKPRSILMLDDDLSKALQKLENISRTLAELPGIDCGSCGSPTCKSLAEDIIQGQAFETDCTFILRKKVGKLAQDMINLSNKVPPPLDKD
jgi:hypothetical protein